jgi:hypothetical protein
VVTPRYIDEPVQLPEPVTIEQANKNIAYLSNLKAQGLIDLDFANSLIADNTTIANNLIAEEETEIQALTTRNPRHHNPHRWRSAATPGHVHCDASARRQTGDQRPRARRT